MLSNIKGLINNLLNKIFGIQVIRTKKSPQEMEQPKLKMKYVHDPAYSYMLKPAHQDLLIDELAKYAKEHPEISLQPDDDSSFRQEAMKDVDKLY